MNQAILVQEPNGFSNHSLENTLKRSCRQRQLGKEIGGKYRSRRPGAHVHVWDLLRNQVIIGVKSEQGPLRLCPHDAALCRDFSGMRFSHLLWSAFPNNRRNVLGDAWGASRYTFGLMRGVIYAGVFPVHWLRFYMRTKRGVLKRIEGCGRCVWRLPGLFCVHLTAEDPTFKVRAPIGALGRYQSPPCNRFVPNVRGSIRRLLPIFTGSSNTHTMANSPSARRHRHGLFAGELGRYAVADRLRGEIS